MKMISSILLLIVLCNASAVASAKESETNIRTLINRYQKPILLPVNYPNNYQLNDLLEQDDGFLSNTDGDSYIVINELDMTRDKACNLLLTLTFKDPLSQPSLFRIFWSIQGGQFRGVQSGQFLINHADTLEQNTFLIPLCKLYNFSGNLNIPDYQKNIDGFRINYPAHKKISIAFNAIEFLSHKQLIERETNQDFQVITLEAYERIRGQSFTSLDAIIPKLLFAFQDGLNRLGRDKGFLFFWLLLISSLVFLFVRSFKRN